MSNSIELPGNGQRRNKRGQLLCDYRIRKGIRAGKLCTKPAKTRVGSTRCQIHGANARRGIAHYNYRGKGYSVVDLLPTKHWKQLYKDARATTELDKARDALALQHAILKELVSRLKSGIDAEAYHSEHLTPWHARLLDMTRRLRELSKEDQIEQRTKLFVERERLIEQGPPKPEQSDKAIRRVSTEGHRLVRMLSEFASICVKWRLWLSIDTVRNVLLALLMAVKDCVPDAVVRQQIGERFQRLTNPILREHDGRP